MYVLAAWLRGRPEQHVREQFQREGACSGEAGVGTGCGAGRVGKGRLRSPQEDMLPLFT